MHSAWLEAPALAFSLTSTAAAAEQVFNIATSAQSGRYFPIAQAMSLGLSEPGVVKVEVRASSGSIANVNARQILRAYGLTECDIKPAYIKGGAAAARMREGTLDALFFYCGVPLSLVTDLAATTDIALLPIDGAAADALRTSNGLYTASNFAPLA